MELKKRSLVMKNKTSRKCLEVFKTMATKSSSGQISNWDFKMTTMMKMLMTMDSTSISLTI